MRWRWTPSAAGASAGLCLIVPLLAVTLAGCNTTGPQASVGTERGATVAFDSIDGPPRDVFDRLVQDLNTEAQNRHVAVVSREGPSTYRVRGYVVADGSSKQSAINWVWDVYDGQRQRVLRIAGEQAVTGQRPDPWQALDPPAVQKIARDSMEQLAAFLASPDASPSVTQVAYGSESSPEAAGIFRVFSGNAATEATTSVTTDIEPTDDVPLPPHRPRADRGKVALAISASR